MPATVPEILGPGGPVAARMRAALGASGYEHRPEQVRMGEAVAAALESRNRLLVEAGTGVGKSFAYLVPAILRCLQRGEKVVIATSTIALQEQLMSKDIPLLMDTLAQWNLGPSMASSAAAGVTPVLLPVLAKGRGNYLSVRRLGQASKRADLILPDAEARASLMAIESWAYSTKDGTLTSLPVLQRPEVWDHVRSDTDNCLGRKCPTYEQCFYQSARKELEKANLIICNHALFFSDLALRTRHARGTATLRVAPEWLEPHDLDRIDSNPSLVRGAVGFIGRDPYPPEMYGAVDNLVQTRRNLPHLRLPDATYFVSWRCIDGVRLNEEEQALALRALLHFHGSRCHVFAACVMPDHVHWLMRPARGEDVEKLRESVKHFSAREINESRGREGRLWEPEGFDHIVRDLKYLAEFAAYIVRNPKEAKLTERVSDYAFTRVHASLIGSGQADGAPSERHAERGGTQIKAILPNYDHVIFDEAHGLEDAACEHFGLSLSMPRVMRLLRTLHSPRRRRGYLLEKSLAIGNAGVVDRALTLVHHAEHACTLFFEDLLQLWRQSGPGGGRMRQADLIDNPLSTAMAELALVLRRIRDGIEDQNERLELGAFAKRASEIGECAAAMVSQSLGQTETGDSAYAYWVEVEGDRPTGTPPPRGGDPDDDHDDAASFGPTPQRRFGPRVTLACAPIEVAQILRAYLFDPKIETEELPLDAGDFDGDPDQPPAPSTAPKPAAPKRIGIILTSATLATRAAKLAEDSLDAPSSARPDSAFAHITKNLGVVAPTTLQLGSPFDYRRQAKVIVDLTVPDPKQTRAQSSGARSFNDALADRILHHLRSTRGGAFVLFTSFATMHASADRLRSSLAREGWPLFVQGRDGSRQAILKKFVQEDDGVLFGAASFWQGVDVRGDRLRNVIITRLPFEPPDRPLVQARNERIELTGGNPFMHDSLPRAIIRFKQGFGRLIRSKSDRGQVVVLDPRIVTARYGRMFLSALPEGLPTQVIKPGVDEFDDAIDVIPEPF